jgi:urease accessory protein
MIATLHIETALRGNSTFLKTSYCTIPFKVANITEDKKDNTLRLMLMSSSPGILDGDAYQQKIMLAPGCALELQTQSYQRLFNMKVGATQNLEVHQATDSAFLFLPHPSVPHEAAIFSATNKIFLSNNCSLIFGEILTCGRKLSGEAFLFSKYHNLTQVYLNNKLIIKENLLMRPAIININAIGQLEGFTHQASLIYLHETADCEIVAQTITEQLAQQSDIIFGITAAPINGLIIRILGQKGEQLHNCLKNIAAILPQVSTHKTEAHAV